MKIIIEVDNNREPQPEIRRISMPIEQTIFNSIPASSTSPVDAGHARIPEGYSNENASTNMNQQVVGNISSTITGAIDAGAARIQEETIRAEAMPDTGNMETLNSGGVFSGGSFANTGSN